jgi:hypothetical protein
MTTFPLLKTGSISQYPLDRALRFGTETVRFLDGSQQSYVLNAGGLRRWRLMLDMLDETEVAAVVAFAEQTQGGTFAFADPATGAIAEKCVFASEQFEAILVNELNGQIALEIEEVK